MENINNTLMDGDLHEKFPNRDEAKKAEIHHFETVVKSFLHYEEHGASALLYLLLSHCGRLPGRAKRFARRANRVRRDISHQK